MTFGLGTFLVEFYDLSDARVPLYLALFAVSNFAGPLLLGHPFDTVGRKPMIAGTYIGSAVVLPGAAARPHPLRPVGVGHESAA